MFCTCCFVVYRTGACFESKNITELLKYVKYVTGILSVQQLWAECFVDNIYTAFCSFLHTDLMCYICTYWNMFNR